MNHDDVWNAIERFAGEHNMSCSRLARQSGLDATTFNRSKRWSKEGKNRWPSMQSISKILTATGEGIDGFVKFLPKNKAQH